MVVSSLEIGTSGASGSGASSSGVGTSSVGTSSVGRTPGGPDGTERRRALTGPATPPALYMRLQGGLKISWQGQELTVSAPRIRALLAYLALEGTSSRETLRGLLWPGLGSQPLRQALHALRQLPGADEWLQTETSVRLLVQTDVQALRRQLLEGEGQVPLDAPARLLPDLDLESMPAFQDWLDTQRQHLSELWRGALQAELRRTNHSDPQRLRRAASHLMSLDPSDEATARHWMRLEAAQGDLERCAEIFGQCRAALRAELGCEPSAETLALLHELEGRSAARDQPGWWLPGTPDPDGSGETTPERLPGQAPGTPSSSAPLSGAPLSGEPLLGRAQELAQARQHLRGEGRVLLHGLAGIGKTRLAQALAATLTEGETEVSGGGRVLWLTLGDDPPQSVLPRLLTLLGASAAPRPLPELIGALRQALDRARSAGARSAGAGLAGAGLAGLVLDDAWNSHTVQTLQDALPPGLPVVLTSRQRHSGWPRVSLDRLQRPDSLRLLGQGRAESQAGIPDATTSDATVSDALCAVLGDHPYALRLAARTLQSGQLGPEALLESLSAMTGPGESPTPGTGTAQVSGVAALLHQSVEALSEEAHEAYLGMGALPSPASSPELLSLLLRRPLEATEAALFELLDRGLVTRHARQGSELTRYAMHDLTWQHACQTRAHLPASVLRATAGYAQGRSADAGALHLDLPNLLGAARLAGASGHPEALVALMAGLLGGPYLATHGFPVGELGLLRAAAQAASARQDWAAAARLHGRLGDIHQALLGELSPATDCYLTARDHAGRAGLSTVQATLGALAATLMAMQGRPEATETLEDALVHARRSGEALCLARVQEQSGILRALQGDFTAARASLLEAAETLHPLLAPQHPRFQEAQALSFNVTRNLGQAAQRLGHLTDALDLKQSALKIALERGERLHAAEAHADIAEVLSLIGGRTDEARAELTQAAALYHDLGATGREQAALTVLAALPNPPS